MSYLLHTWQPTLLMISKLSRYMMCRRFLVFLWRIPWWLWEMHRKIQWKWMPQTLQPIPSLHLEVGTLALLLLVAFLVSVSSPTRLKKKWRNNVSISFPPPFFFLIKLQHSIIICKDYKESSEHSLLSSFHETMEYEYLFSGAKSALKKKNKTTKPKLWQEYLQYPVQYMATVRNHCTQVTEVVFAISCLLESDTFVWVNLHSSTTY